MFRKMARGVLTLALLLVWGAQSLAGPRIVCPPEPIKIGFFEFGVLFSVERKDWQRKGFGIDRDLAQELEKRSGCRFEGHLMSRARIWTELQEGRLDMTLSAIKTPEREAIAWMIPYSVSQQVILMSARVPIGERSEPMFLANRERKFAAVRGFRHAPYHDAILDRLRGEGRVVDAVDETQLFDMLKTGVADAIIAQHSLYASYLDQHALGKTVHVLQWNPKPELTVAHLLLLRKSFSAVEAEQWRALLEEIRRDGTALALALRYFDRDAAHRMQLPKNLEVSRFAP